VAGRQGRLLQPGALLVLLSGLLTGCFISSTRHGPTRQLEHGPTRFEVPGVPFHPQKTYQCGPAALAMALSWSGRPTDPQALIPEVYTPNRKGSFQTALVGATRRHGRVAYPISGMDALLAEVAGGHPVIVLQNLGLSWYPIWHYAIVIGYDLPQGVIILHSGRTAREHLSFRTFENTWSRSGYWGLAVLRPTELPAAVEKEAYLEAVLGLEKAGQWQAAVAGYETALTRWPESLGALMGLGNSLYALNELNRAEAAFRKACRLHPTSGPAFNNLAQVLLEQGRKQEALKAVRRAITCGGPANALYRKTLEEIEAREQ
jgi:hypothetical protein